MINKKKNTIVWIVGLLALLYLVNPGMGIFEFIPDNFPLIGNLDEATATYLLVAALSYFGIDLRNVFGNRSDKK